MLSGCGGGGVSDSNIAVIKQSPAPSATILTGKAAKGPVRNGTVYAYSVVNGAKGDLLTSSLTNSQGDYSLSILSYDGPIILDIVGGVYKDEATGVDKPLSQPLKSIVPDLKSQKVAHITPLTHMAVKVLDKKGSINKDTMQDSLNQISNLYSLPSLLSTTPNDPSSISNSTISSAESQYGFILSGFSQLGSTLNTDPLNVIAVISQDAADGQLDGKVNATQAISFQNKELSPTLGTSQLSQAITQFSTSTQNITTAKPDVQLLTNLLTSNGNVSDTSVQLTLDNFPSITNQNSFSLTGKTFPGNATVQVLQLNQLKSSIISNSEGVFAVPIQLQRNQNNQFVIRVISGQNQTERTISTIQHSLAPTLSILNPPTNFINSNSITLSYTLSSDYSSPFILTGSSSSGVLTIASDAIHLNSMQDGDFDLFLQYRDQLGNLANNTISFIVDTQSPSLITTIATWANTNLVQSINFSETMSSVFYSFVNGSASDNFVSLQAPYSVPLNFTNEVSYRLRFQGTDLAGNSLTSNTQQITFDNTLPNFVSHPNLPIITNSSVIAFQYLTDSATSAVDLSISYPDLSTYKYGVLTQPNTSFTIPNQINGNYTFNFSLNDLAGNQSSYSTSVFLDFVPPNPPSISSNNVLTNSTQLLLNLSKENLSTLRYYNLNSPNNYFYSASSSITLSSIPSNTSSTYCFQAIDTANNFSSCTNFYVTHDSLPVSFSTAINTNSSTTYLNSTHTVQISLQSTQAEPGASLTCRLISRDYQFITTDQRNFNVSIPISNFTTNSEVSPTISFFTTDLAKNSSSSFQILTYTIDTVSPTFSSIQYSSTQTYIGLGQSLVVTVTLANNETSGLLNHSSNIPLSFNTVSNFYSAQTTIVSTHVQSYPNYFSIPFSYTDLAGNTTSILSTSPYIIDTAPPIIDQLDNTALQTKNLKIGDNVVFEMSLRQAEPLLNIVAQYNSVPLTFVAQTNNQVYRATYTVSPSHPMLIASSASLTLSSISDAALNTASIDLSKVSTVKAIIDNRLPIINNVSVSHPPTSSLTLSQSVSFIVSLDNSVENTASVTQINVSGTYNSQVLSFTPIVGNPYSQQANYNVTRGSINQTNPVALSYFASDSFGNSSIASSFNTSFSIDSQIPILGNLSLLKNSNKSTIITSELVTLKFAYNTLPTISNITGDVLLGASSTSLSFVTTSNPYTFTSTWLIPSSGITTNILTLQNIVITETSGNQSIPETSHIYSSFNQNLTSVPLLIDTSAPIVKSITANKVRSSIFGINDHVTFSITPLIPETNLSLSLDFNGYSLSAVSNSTGSIYSTTYTLLETHNSALAGIDLTNVVFTDSHLLTGPSSTNLALDFVLNPTKPVLQSISTTATKISTLIINDKIFFSVIPTLASSDTTSVAGWFNAVTLSFIASSTPNMFVSTYTVLSTHSDWLTSGVYPQLGVILTDSAGNSNSLTYSTSLAYHIDAHLPIISILSYTPTVAKTYAIGHQLNFSFDVLSSADKNLSVSGSYLTSNLQFFSNTSGTQYSSTFSFPESTNTSNIAPELLLNVSDAAGNSLTTQTTGLSLSHIDVVRPVLTTVTSTGVTQYTSQIGVGQSIRFSVAVSKTSTSGGVDPIHYLQAKYKGQNLSFSTTDNGFHYTAFYTTNSSTPSTSALENITNVLAFDTSGNSSIPLSGSDMAYSIDTVLPVVQSIDFTSLTTPLLNVGDIVRFAITPNAGTLDSISANGSFNSTALTFVSSGNSFVSTYTVKAGDPDHLYNLSAFPQVSAWLTDDAGNESLHTQSTNMQLFIDANSAPIIVSATSIFSTSGTANETHLKIGDSIQFFVTLSSAFTAISTQIHSSYHSKVLSFSLVSGSTTTYTSTYVVSESNPMIAGTTASYVLSYETSLLSNTTRLDFTSLYNNRNTIDNRRPVLASISTTASAIATLKLNDQIFFSVVSDLSSSDTASVSGWFNSVTLSFIPSSAPNTFNSTYTVLSTHSDWLSASMYPQLTVTLMDASGNTSNATQTTTMTHHIDAHPPVISILSYTPTTPTTFKVGSLLNFNFNVLSSPEKTLSVTGSYLTSSLLFLTNSAGTNYSSTFSFVASTNTTIIAPDLSITVSDLAGNSITTSTTNLIQSSIDVSIPIIASLTSSFDLTVGAIPNTTTHLKIGDSIFFSVVMSSQSTSDFDHLSGSYNGINLNFSAESMGSETYIATYTLAEGHSTQTSTLAILDIYAYDKATNASLVATSMVTRIVDTSRPSIMSVTSSSIATVSYIELNEQLFFSVNSLESNGTVTAAYNGVNLSWTELLSFPGTYSTTYTALSTHSDHVTPLQITGVLLYDLAGNASAVSSSIDVTNSIDINIPVTPTISPESMVTNVNPLPILVTGLQNLDLYVNDLYQSKIGATGTTYYNASLVGSDINTFNFVFKDSLGKPSDTKLGYYQYDSAAGLKVLTSSRAGLKSTDVEVNLIRESLHEEGLFYIASRAGLGSLHFDNLNYSVLDNGLDNYLIEDISQHPDSSSSSTLFLGTQRGGFYSSNSGDSFNKISTGTLDTTTIYNYLMISGDSNTVYAATSDGLYRSLDSGSLFSKFASGGPGAASTATRDLHSLQYEASSFKIFAGFEGGLYSYDTVGTSWSSALSDTAQISKISFAPSQSSTMFIISTQFLLSEDILLGSPSFSNVTPVTAISLSINDLSLTTIPAKLYVASTYGILESTNQGSTYLGPRATAAAFVDTNYNTLDVRKSSPNQLMAGSNTKLIRVANTQTIPYSYIDITNKIPPKVNAISSPQTNATSVFISTEKWIYKYTHASDTWDLIVNPTPLTTYTQLYPKLDTQKLWFGTDGDGLQQSNFDGSSISYLSLPVFEVSTTINSIYPHPFNDNILLVGLENYGLMYTSNGGTTFTSSNTGLAAQSIIDVDANDDASLLFALSDTSVYSASNLSSPAALTWVQNLCAFTQAQDILVSVKPNTLTTELYIIAQGDIVFSSNLASSCLSTTLGFSPQIISAIDYTTPTTRVFYVGTNQGLYKSFDLENGIMQEVTNNHKTNVHSIEIYKETTFTIDLMIGTDNGSYILHDVKP